jgi:hypothetical protein
LKLVNFASAFKVFFDSASRAIERRDGLAGAGRRASGKSTVVCAIERNLSPLHRGRNVAYRGGALRVTRRISTHHISMFGTALDAAHFHPCQEVNARRAAKSVLEELMDVH